MYNNSTKDYDVVAKKILGETLRVYVLRKADECGNEHYMLKVSLMDWGGFEVSFLTEDRYIAINRKVCRKDLVKLSLNLRAYYGDDVDLSNDYTAGVWKRYALFDLEKVWEDMGHSIIGDFQVYHDKVRNWEYDE